MDISGNIRNFRKIAGYSQGFLADLLNVNKGTVGAWERGAQKPGSDNICELARIFKVSADELLGLKDNAVFRYGRRDEFGLELRPEFVQEYKYNLNIARHNYLSLSDIMEERGMSRKDLAKELDVTAKTVCNWETKGLPGLQYYQRMFKVLNFDIDTFQALR